MVLQGEESKRPQPVETASVSQGAQRRVNTQNEMGETIIYHAEDDSDQ